MTLRQLSEHAGRSAHYESDEGNVLGTSSPSCRLIAFYLPQFHPIPENDRWWGKGFTEWTIVAKALPQFAGHYQPHLPGELGFYDLRIPETLHRQAELARRHGIYGFCFHYYWFSGKKLLDTPLRILLTNPSIELPFCINWANHNWTRRWDGKESEILIDQEHSEADDLAFAEALVPVVGDPRYIRVDGRPLVMVYQPCIMPGPAATVARWRRHFEQAGLGNPFVVMPQAFDDNDPRRYGMDAAVEFPPHKVGWGTPVVNASIRFLNPFYHGSIMNYDEMVWKAVTGCKERFKVFRGVCPSWDNSARRPNDGVIFKGATPAKYGKWLETACLSAMEAELPDERIVFINAWNEWGEGAHLEPDRRFGYAFLRETARVQTRLADPSLIREKRRIAILLSIAAERDMQEQHLSPIVWSDKRKLIGKARSNDEFKSSPSISRVRMAGAALWSRVIRQPNVRIAEHAVAKRDLDRRP